MTYRLRNGWKLVVVCGVCAVGIGSALLMPVAAQQQTADAGPRHGAEDGEDAVPAQRQSEEDEAEEEDEAAER